MLWVRISIMVRCTTLCYTVCQWLAAGRWFSPGPPISSINKAERHDIAEILLKVALNTIKQTKTKQKPNDQQLPTRGRWWTIITPFPCSNQNIHDWRQILLTWYIVCNLVLNIDLTEILRNESGRIGALKSDSTHHFFRNACSKSGSLRFSQFSGCWLILSVYILMSFDFPFVRLFGVR
jgi:hypothetical protein